MTTTHAADHAGGQPLARLRVFEMVRHHDVTGIGDAGVVADGVEFPDESIAFRWRGPNASTVVFDTIDAVIAVHGHGGATEIRWIAAIPTHPPRPEGREGHHDPHWPPPIAP